MIAWLAARPQFAAGLVLTLALLGLLGFGALHIYEAGKQAGYEPEHALRMAEMAQYVKNLADAKAKGEADTKALQDGAATDKRSYDEQMQVLGAAVSRLSASVQLRAARPASPASVPNATADSRPSASGCTGAGLYRDDASFLVWQNSEADKLRGYLKQCYAQYDRARALSLTPAQ